MSRKGSAKKREILGDPIYGQEVVTKLINYVMMDGKKSVAEKVVYGAFKIIEDKLKTDPFEVFKRSLENITPSIEVRSRRVGGATYQVPVEVRDERAASLSLRWLVTSAQGRSEKSMKDKLGAEIMDAYNNRGGAIAIKENKRKMAESNKAFAHYRW
jgi:small subunit ribosomal protein S7